jgi:uncharacterized membrane protein
MSSTNSTTPVSSSNSDPSLYSSGMPHSSTMVDSSHVPGSSTIVNSSNSLPSDSSCSCDPIAVLEISKEVYDFGKFTPPDIENWARIETITNRLKEINDRMVAIVNDINADPENMGHWGDLGVISDEAKALGEELQGFGFTITPLIPLPVDGGVTVTLLSDPTGLPGGIGFAEREVRRGQNALGVGVGDWEPPATGAGETDFSVEFTLTGNYGIVTFVGSVVCCGENAESNAVTLVVTGMCQREAQAELDAFLAKKGAVIAKLVRILFALAAFVSAMIPLLLQLVAAVPLGGWLAALGAIVSFAAVLFLTGVAERLQQDWNAAQQKIKDLADPYIKSLPPCK